MFSDGVETSPGKDCSGPFVGRIISGISSTVHNSRAVMWNDCALLSKSMKLGRLIIHVKLNIIRYGATEISSCEQNGGHFSKWPPLQSWTGNISALRADTNINLVSTPMFSHTSNPMEAKLCWYMLSIFTKIQYGGNSRFASLQNGIYSFKTTAQAISLINHRSLPRRTIWGLFNYVAGVLRTMKMCSTISKLRWTISMTSFKKWPPSKSEVLYFQL